MQRWEDGAHKPKKPGTTRGWTGEEEPSPGGLGGARPVDPLISGFQPPELGEKKHLSLYLSWRPRETSAGVSLGPSSGSLGWGDGRPPSRHPQDRTRQGHSTALLEGCLTPETTDQECRGPEKVWAATEADGQAEGMSPLPQVPVSRANARTDQTQPWRCARWREEVPSEMEPPWSPRRVLKPIHTFQTPAHAMQAASFPDQEWGRGPAGTDTQTLHSQAFMSQVSGPRKLVPKHWSP